MPVIIQRRPLSVWQAILHHKAATHKAAPPQKPHPWPSAFRKICSTPPRTFQFIGGERILHHSPLGHRGAVERVRCETTIGPVHALDRTEGVVACWRLGAIAKARRRAGEECVGRWDRGGVGSLREEWVGFWRVMLVGIPLSEHRNCLICFGLELLAI
jgi:hypothetical protein